jgi:predicted CDP-diglyceride synthetase/phosphatidate cytidylyltransferase
MSITQTNYLDSIYIYIMLWYLVGLKCKAMNYQKVIKSPSKNVSSITRPNLDTQKVSWLFCLLTVIKTKEQTISSLSICINGLYKYLTKSQVTLLICIIIKDLTVYEYIVLISMEYKPARVWFWLSQLSSVIKELTNSNNTYQLFIFDICTYKNSRLLFRVLELKPE